MVPRCDGHQSIPSKTVRQHVAAEGVQRSSHRRSDPFMLGLDPPPPSQAPTVISSCSAPPKPASSTHCIGTQRLGGNSLFQELLTPPMSSQILVRMNVLTPYPEILRALFLLCLYQVLPSNGAACRCRLTYSSACRPLPICLEKGRNALSHGRSNPSSLRDLGGLGAEVRTIRMAYYCPSDPAPIRCFRLWLMPNLPLAKYFV
jgi:hypothetical protein